MRAEIISVGTELLLGDILNTNAQYLAQQLAALGYSVYYQTVVGDNAGRLRQLIYDAKERSDVLIFTGGLGPTKDDLTKETVADAFGDSLILDTDELVRLEYFFKKRGVPMTDNNRKQAMVPKNGQKLPNPNGTAPGAWFRQGGKYAVLLPGPPSEMRPMFEEYVKPLLEAMQDGAIRSVVLRVFGIGESVLEDILAPLLEGSNPTAALYAKTGEVHVRVTAKGPTADQADIMCDETAGLIRDALGDVIYSDNGSDLETTVVHLLMEEGASLATAESCTGGLLAERLTGVPGASAVFGFGAVTYANDTKRQMLGVKGGTLRRYGAVSSQVAAEMAFGAASKGDADYGIGITGIAGPDGGTAQKPVGLVYVALAAGSTVYVRRLSISDRGRDYVRAMATQHSLDMARRAILGLPISDAKAFTKGQQADFDRVGAPKRRGAAVLRTALAILVAALVLFVVGVLASRGGGQEDQPSNPGMPSAQGLRYGTAEYTTAACSLVALAAAENPSVVGLVALPNAKVERLVAQVRTGQQQALDDAVGGAGTENLAVMAGSAAPGTGGTNTVILGGEGFEPLLDYRNTAYAKELTTFTYYTARDARVYEILAVYLYDEDASVAGDDFSPTVQMIRNYDDFLDFIVGEQARSLYEIPVDTAMTDSYMALAVADPEVAGRRLYMAGRLLRIGETITETSKAAAAGSPLMPAAWYAENGSTAPDIDDVTLYWLQRLVTDGVTTSALQLAAGMPTADKEPLVWRTGRVTPAPPSSSAPPASQSQADASDEAGGDGSAAEGADSVSSTSAAARLRAATRASGASAGAAMADASGAIAASSAAGDDGSASAPADDSSSIVIEPPPVAVSQAPQLIAERPDPGWLTVKMNGEVITDTTTNVLAWVCQREAAGLSGEAVKAVAVAVHSWILNQQGSGVEAPAVVGAKPSTGMLGTVQQVAQQVLSADGKNPAFTPMFATSAYGTNTAENVWRQYRAYLTGVDSPYELNRTGWRQLVTVTPEALSEMAAIWLGIDLYALGAPESWFADIAKTDTGYVTQLTLGGVPVGGTEFWTRLLVQNGAPLLPSPAFEVEYKGTGFTFVCTGSGHGCGLSLSGAAAYAREGWDYARILTHYFSGATLMTWD